MPLAQARAEDFDALLLPGGVMNPDKLRRNVVVDSGLVTSRRPKDIPAFNQ